MLYLVNILNKSMDRFSWNIVYKEFFKGKQASLERHFKLHYKNNVHHYFKDHQ